MIWLIILAAAVAVGFSQAGEAPPVPDAPPRCPELVVDAAWLSSRKIALGLAIADLKSNSGDNAVEALLRSMQRLAPDCDWTPSTTTEIVAGSNRIRFDEIIRKIQGLTVREAEAMLSGVDPLSALEGAAPGAGATLVELVLGASLSPAADATEGLVWSGTYEQDANSARSFSVRRNGAQWAWSIDGGGSGTEPGPISALKTVLGVLGETAWTGASDLVENPLVKLTGTRAKAILVEGRIGTYGSQNDRYEWRVTMGGTVVADGTGSASPGAALIAMLDWFDAHGGGVEIVAPPKPPVPTAPPKPTGGPEGAGTPTPAACTRTRADGDATVCLRRLPTGKWSWTWTPKSGESLEGVAASSADAVILAYQAAAKLPVEYVVAEPVSRSGVKLLRDGTIELVDPNTWGLAVYKRLREQWTQGERDPMGLVLAALQLTFPAANWFRLQPPGGLEQTAQRVELVAQQNADAPDIVDRLARAMVGAQYDPQHHVFRGRAIDIKPSSQGWYSYRVDGGPWVGAYKTQDQAIAAAHGA